MRRNARGRREAGRGSKERRVSFDDHGDGTKWPRCRASGVIMMRENTRWRRRSGSTKKDYIVSYRQGTMLIYHNHAPCAHT